MSHNKNNLRTILLVILVLSGSYLAYQQYDKYRLKVKRENAVQLARDAVNPFKAPNLVEFRKRFYKNNSRYINNWATLPAEQQESNWIRREKNRVSGLIENEQYDVVVLPVQENVTSIDRESRLLTSRFIADELRSRTDYKVMPVEIVQRLLGERAFRYSDDDIGKLAKKYNVKKVVNLYSKYGIETDYNLIAVVTDPVKISGIQELKIKVSKEVGNSIDLAVFEKAPELVEKIFSEVSERHNRKVYELPGVVTLPESLTELLNEEGNNLKRAVNLQLLATFTPVNNDYERKRLFERSLVALRHVDKNSPMYNLLMARAMFNLYRRPVAMLFLGEPKTPEEIAYLHYLNGDYYKLEKEYKNIKSPLFSVIAYGELQYLNYRYEIYKDISEPVFYHGDSYWKPIIESYLKDQDIWYAPNNLGFFNKLAGLYPKFDESYLSTLSGKIVTGDISEYDSNNDLLVEKSFDDLIKNASAGVCCFMDESIISEHDLLVFYRNLATSNMLRKLKVKTYAQGNYSSAISLIAIYDTLFDGHVSFLEAKSRALSGKLKQAQGAERENIVQQVFETASLAKNLAAGTEYSSISASRILYPVSAEYLKAYPGKRAELRSSMITPYMMDEPAKLFNDELNTVGAALEYTNTKFEILMKANDEYEKNRSYYKGLTKEQLETMLIERFDGHPKKIPYIAKIKIKEGDRDSALELLKQAVDEKSISWDVYSTLASLYLDDGNYKMASQIYRKYPAFSEKDPEQRVLVSNLATIAGDKFFWQGEYEYAKPFYEISTNLRTGSGYSLTGAQRLMQIQGNYLKAAQIAGHTASRYNSKYRYRDYLSYLHLFGMHEKAFSGFGELSARYKTPEVWESLFVGQRMKKNDLHEIRKWVNKYKEKDLHKNIVNLANRYLVMQSLTDRKLDKEKVKEISESIQKKYSNIALMDIPESKLYLYLNGGELSMSDFDRRNIILNKPKQNPEDTISIPDKRIYFLEPYQELKEKSYEQAYEKFKDYVRIYDIHGSDSEIGSLVLPYLALTITGKEEKQNVEKYLSEVFKDEATHGFDYLLTKSVLLASDKQYDVALEKLDKAFLKMPSYNEYRLIDSWYQLIEVSEQIYDQSKDRRFIDKALIWAKKHQAIQMEYAWAYSFEAKYGKSKKDKIRATAFAMYLDPNSNWLSSVPKNIKSKARIWWKNNNPFKIPKEQQKVKSAA